MGKLTRIFDNVEQRICGTELKDEKDRLVRITHYVDEEYEEEVEHKYVDIDDDKSYYKCEEIYRLVNTKLGVVEKRTTTKYVYIYGNEYPFSIKTEEANQETGFMEFTENYDLYISREDLNDRMYVIKCTDIVSNLSITYTIDKLNDLITRKADEINNVYTTTDSYIVGEKPENRYQVNIEETSIGSGDDEDYIRIETFTYDNGLYERNFKYDKDNKFLGGYIRIFFTTGLISHEYEIDDHYEITSGRYFIYNDGEPVCIHDGQGNVLYEYMDGNEVYVPREYPNINLTVGTNYSDKITT